MLEHAGTGLCTRCGYSLGGLDRLSAAVASDATPGGVALVRCPECGMEQPASGAAWSPRARRAIACARWTGRIALAGTATFLFVIAMLFCVVRVSGVASHPFGLYLANSDLASPEYRGERWAEIDEARYTPEVAESMFRDSGGWDRALRRQTWMAAMAAFLASVLLGAGLAAATWFIPLWATAIVCIGATSLSTWGAWYIYTLCAESPSVGCYAGHLADARVAMPVALVVGILCGSASVIGVALVGFCRRRVRGSWKQVPPA